MSEFVLNELFNKISETRGDVANIHKEYRDYPQGVLSHFNFYENVILKNNGPLSRAHIEYLAFKTSQANECPYCINHHKEAFKNQAFEITQAEMDILTEFALLLTREPWKANGMKRRFLSVGFTNSQFAHAIFVVSYFNMANRLAFGMNLELEESFQKTCK